MRVLTEEDHAEVVFLLREITTVAGCVGGSYMDAIFERARRAEKIMTEDDPDDR